MYKSQKCFFVFSDFAQKTLCTVVVVKLLKTDFIFLFVLYFSLLVTMSLCELKGGDDSSGCFFRIVDRVKVLNNV